MGITDSLTAAYISSYFLIKEMLLGRLHVYVYLKLLFFIAVR